MEQKKRRRTIRIRIIILVAILVSALSIAVLGVYSWDKAGIGQSTGHWLDQSIAEGDYGAYVELHSQLAIDEELLTEGHFHFVRRNMDSDSRGAIELIPGEVLVLMGEDDGLVDVAQSALDYGKHHEVQLVPAASHALFSSDIEPDALVWEALFYGEAVMAPGALDSLGDFFTQGLR